MDAGHAEGWRARSLSAAEAALAGLYGRRREAIGFSGLRLSFEPPGQGGDAPEPPALALRIGDEPATLRAPDALIDAVLGALDPAAPASAGQARLLLLELALLPALERLAGLSAELDVRIADAASVPHAAAIGLLVETRDGTVHPATLAVSPPALRAIVAAAAARSVAPVIDPTLPLSLSLRVGAMELSLAELRDLRQGDVVLPEVVSLAEPVVVLGERQAWRARVIEGALTVASRRCRVGAAGLERWTMGEREGEAVADAPVDEVPVRLVFELGRMEITVGELGTIAPGHVFPLPCDPSRPIDLLVGGRRIGRGEIVSIGETLGVRMVSLGRGE